MNDLVACLKRTGLMIVCSLFLSFGGTVVTSSAAYAGCCGCSGDCSCVINNHGDCGGSGTRGVICEQHDLTQEHITEEFRQHQFWIFYTFFREHVLPAWMKMTEQLSAVGIQQTEIIGAFFDAKQQLEVQRILQMKEAEAHRDYSADVELCMIGTTTRSLAASDRLAEFNALFLTQHSQNRQLGNKNSNASEGLQEDREGRVEQFKRMFCHIRDNNEGLEPMCGPMTARRQRNANKDIDFTRFLGISRTIDVDFSDDVLTEDEETLIAMQNYIFAHNVFYRPTASNLSIIDNQADYYDSRAVVAKRSVALNSFNTVAALKSSGTDSSPRPYMGALIRHLGVTNDNEITHMIGERPSYFAMLEVMAKKIYQQPEFFANLYDKPANVRRKDVAMQAVDLIVGRDLFHSELRSEALYALLLEMELSRYQEDIQSRMEKTDLIYDYGKEN